MLLISRRGNLFGPRPELENTTEYLNDAIIQGYHVMVDVWWHDHGFWFGTTHPSHKPIGGGEGWLQYAINSVLVHARNPEALLRATDLGYNVFWRQTDQYALSSWGNLLGFNGVPACGDNFVHVFPSQSEFRVDNQHIEKVLDWAERDYAFCSEYVGTLEQYVAESTTPSNDPRAVSSAVIA